MKKKKKDYNELELGLAKPKPFLQPRLPVGENFEVKL